MTTTTSMLSERRLHGAAALTMGLAASWLPAVLVVASRLVAAGSVPDHIASHWRGSARPDGISSTSGMFAAALAVTTIGAVVATVAVLLRRRSPAIANLGILLGPVVAAAIAGSWLISLWATVAAGSAENATLGPRIAVIVPALALGFLPIAVLRQPAHPRGPRVPVRALDLEAGERAAWSAVIGGRVFVVVAALLSVAALVVGLVVEPLTGVVLGLGAVLAAAFGRTEITADRRGLRLRSWMLGIPFKHIALADIADVHSEHIDPMRWGGWGYRVAPGRSALVLHAGPGLVVERGNGGVFAVTVDDPETPASLLTALVRSAR